MNEITPSPEQQLVIDHGPGPLRVIAGAGAGKTLTMAKRLVELIRQGTAPERALGITFTNKAAEQLTQRLRDELEELYATGRAVQVHTYHGFAHSLITEFGALVGMERSATLVGPGYQRELMRRALGDGAYSHLDLTAPGHRVDEMSRLWGQLGDNLRAPADLLERGDGEVDERRAELAAALVRYQGLKRERNVFDYNDLIGGTHRLLAGNEHIRDKIASRYDAVLLDEYQDTNGAQRMLLLQLFGNGKTVTAVGDSDQTIYEWRGASLANFDDFPEHFAPAPGEGAPTLQLSTNYRSGKLILDLANRVKAQIQGGSGVDELRPAPDAGPGYVGVGRFRRRDDEAEFIASEIRRIADGDWRSVACLFRRNADIAPVTKALEQAGIPVEVASLGGLLQVPVVNDLHAWLRALGSPDDAVPVARLLTRGRYRLGLGDLVPLTRWVGAQVGDEAEGAPGWVLLEAIDNLESVGDVSDDVRPRLVHFRDLYRSLLEESQGVSLVELCLRILDRTGTWQEVEALDDSRRLSARLNLYRFLDLAEEWSPLEGRPSLQAFLDYLELLDEESSNDELDTARLSGENAVALTTIHRAKGLEWPIVFLPVVIDKVLPQRGRGLDDPDTKPGYLPFDLRMDPPPALPDKKKDRDDILRSRALNQEWRVAYVAVTRAQERLYLTGAHWYDGVTARDPSELHALAADLAAADVIAEQEAGERPESAWRPQPPETDHVFAHGWETALRDSLADPSWPAAAAKERGIAEAYAREMDQIGMELGDEAAPPPEADDQFRTSVTGLVTYATCPKRFLWSEVDRLPRRPSAAARRGVEIHRRIELHNRGAMARDWEPAEPYDVAPGEHGEGEGGFAAFESSRFAEVRPTFVEVPFDLALEAGRIRGRIDAIYTEDGAWEIVDFKSGKPRNDAARRVQLEAYAVAATDVPFTATGPESIRVTFAYLGDGLTEVTEDVDDDWLDQARAHLEELASDAAAERYPTQPSDACHNCDFLRFCEAGKAFVEG